MSDRASVTPRTSLIASVNSTAAELPRAARNARGLLTREVEFRGPRPRRLHVPVPANYASPVYLNNLRTFFATMSFSVDAAFEDLPEGCAKEVFKNLTCEGKAYMCKTNSSWREFCKTPEFLKECQTAVWETRGLSERVIKKQIELKFPKGGKGGIDYITKVDCTTSFDIGMNRSIVYDANKAYTANDNQSSAGKAFAECYKLSVQWKESETMPERLEESLQAVLNGPDIDEVFDFEGDERTPQKLFENLKKDAEVKGIELTVTYVKK